MATDTEDDGTDHDRLMGIVRSHVAQLAEHFETVQIFVTRHCDDDIGTTSCHRGSGNWFARYGQVREWCTKQDETMRADVRDERNEP